MASMPYLVMEYVPETLQIGSISKRRDMSEVARPALLAQAVDDLHRQDVCHLIETGERPAQGWRWCRAAGFWSVLHADHPDLLAEEMRTAVGSHVWIAPSRSWA
jgi:hypothetical protein